MTAFGEVQDYVERLTRSAHRRRCPTATWETEDYIDFDPAGGEGLVPIKVKLTIEGDQVALRPERARTRRSARSSTRASARPSPAVDRGHEDVLPRRPAELRLLPRRSRSTSGRRARSSTRLADRGHRLLLRALREDHERDLRAVVADHARARDGVLRSTSSTCSSAAATRAATTGRSSCGTTGWPAAGAAATAATAPTHVARVRRRPRRAAARGPGAAVARSSPRGHEIIADSGGPGQYRGGCGVEKGGTLTAGRGAPSCPTAATARARSRGASRAGCRRCRTACGSTAAPTTSASSARSSPTCRSTEGDAFTRPSAGGGGFGDPLERDPRRGARGRHRRLRVRSSAPRTDYGVVVRGDRRRARASTRSTRRPPSALRDEIARRAARLARRGRGGRRRAATATASSTCSTSCASYGVIVDWGTGELLERTTAQFRAMLGRRAAAFWPES